MVDACQLHTDRLVLRPHSVSDFDDSAGLWADPAVVRHISGNPSTREESWSRLLRSAGHWQMLGFGYWVVRLRNTEAFLGEVGFANFQRSIEPRLDGKPEAGWVFTTSSQGQGYAREAVTRMLEWADKELVANSTACIIDPDHRRSISLAQSMGYRQSHETLYHDEPTVVFTREKPE